MDPRDRAFETAGLMMAEVYDLEVWAADIQDDAVDRLIDVVRFDVRQLGNRLALLKKEREALKR
jgi:enamine deaminase RidA (YjgF/YER057c/UK114 family)